LIDIVSYGYLTAKMGLQRKKIAVRIFLLGTRPWSEVVLTEEITKPPEPL